MRIVRSIIFVCFVMPVFLLLALLFLGSKKIRPRKRHRAVSIELLFDGKKGNEMQELKVGDKVVGTIDPRDDKGFPAKIDGKPVFANSDPETIAMSVSEDGMSITCEALKPGAALIGVDVDADLGEGVENLHAEEILSVASGKAVSIGFNFSPA